MSVKSTEKSKEYFHTLELQTLDSMTSAEFNSMMEKGLKQARAEEGVDIEKAFAQISHNI